MFNFIIKYFTKLITFDTFALIHKKKCVIKIKNVYCNKIVLSYKLIKNSCSFIKSFHEFEYYIIN